MKLNRFILWAGVALGCLLILLGNVLVGVIILATLFLNHAIYRASQRHATSPTDKTETYEYSPNEEIEDTEPEFSLNITDESLEKNSGWITWTMYPKQQRLENNSCFGGPPTFVKVYEYDMRGTSVFIRMLESSEEGFDGKTYEVFNGAIVKSQVEHKCAVLKSKHPELIVKSLQSKIEWHNASPVLRYFVLAHTQGTRDYLWSERRRLETAYESVAKEAEKLGAMWREGNYYVPPDTATVEQKQAINDFQSEDNLLRFGISFDELNRRKEIMSILDTALATGN